MKKIIKYTLLGLLALGGIAVLVLYFIFPTDTKNTINYFWDLLNKPLPIIGITTVALLVFVWQFFSHSAYGKKMLAQLREEHDKLVNDANGKIKELEQMNEELANQNNELKGFITHVCELSTNQKIKNYGKELLGYGKEAINSEETTD